MNFIFNKGIKIIKFKVFVSIYVSVFRHLLFKKPFDNIYI
ncbi:hypothetical protein GCM10010275_72570 [Streptomyces litmocidini]|nr:hypothetical protein GCM10010233_66250 [Streptomyces gancidicus]GGV20804.1 hypothetical protein GCM10010275_72570 [Streptomyces litmocidini]